MHDFMIFDEINNKNNFKLDNYSLLQVDMWISEIQKVTKLDWDPSSGTALQEISFWVNL